MSDTIYTNALGQALPWESLENSENRFPETPTSTVVKAEPPRKSLAWMQLHMKEFFTLRGGRTYRPPDPAFEEKMHEVEAIFSVK